jgi:AcrR family transcriptional regulator
MTDRRSGTRDRIQAVALDLFADQGYDQTSLREIAERLDLTKAALYYHFNTKEDIVVSLFDALLADLDEIIAWLGDQPSTPETRRRLIERYALLTRRWPPGLRRLIQDCGSTMREPVVTGKLRERFRTMARLLSPPGAPAVDRLKSAMALFAVNSAAFVLQDADLTPAEQYDAGVALALELVSDQATAPRPHAEQDLVRPPAR